MSGVRLAVRGKVWLVGAGPGDPELLTVRAARVIAGARVVAYDELVPEAVLDLAPHDAERIAVGSHRLQEAFAGRAAACCSFFFALALLERIEVVEDVVQLARWNLLAN